MKNIPWNSIRECGYPPVEGTYMIAWEGGCKVPKTYYDIADFCYNLKERFPHDMPDSKEGFYSFNDDGDPVQWRNVRAWMEIPVYERK